MDDVLSRLEHLQREREKELDGLYRLAALYSRSAGDVPEILEGSAGIIRSSMQVPDGAAVTVSLGTDVAVAGSPDGAEGGTPADVYRVEHSYAADRVLYLEVACYRPGSPSGGSSPGNPVIAEREKRLVDSAARLLGNVLLRMETTEALRERTAELERKNIALREVLHEIEREKAEILGTVATGIDSLVMPLLQELRRSVDLCATDRATVVLIEGALDELTVGDPGRTILAIRALTPREAEIAGLVRSGMSTKEIAEFLHIAAPTVERHRNTIRKKLGIQGREVNLTTYLRFPE
jgi:DNA-binding CsgD family transcriptional regulator